MSDLRAAAQQALEALEHGWIENGDEVVAALRAALEQPEQEPIDTLAEFEPMAGRTRQWVSVGAWLHPGERIVHLGAAASSLDGLADSEGGEP